MKGLFRPRGRTSENRSTRVSLVSDQTWFSSTDSSPAGNGLFFHEAPFSSFSPESPSPIRKPASSWSPVNRLKSLRRSKPIISIKPRPTDAIIANSASEGFVDKTIVRLASHTRDSDVLCDGDNRSHYEQNGMTDHGLPAIEFLAGYSPLADGNDDASLACTDVSSIATEGEISLDDDEDDDDCSQAFTDDGLRPAEIELDLDDDDDDDDVGSFEINTEIGPGISEEEMDLDKECKIFISNVNPDDGLPFLKGVGFLDRECDDEGDVAAFQANHDVRSADTKKRVSFKGDYVDRIVSPTSAKDNLSFSRWGTSLDANINGATPIHPFAGSTSNHPKRAILGTCLDARGYDVSGNLPSPTQGTEKPPSGEALTESQKRNIIRTNSNSSGLGEYCAANSHAKTDSTSRRISNIDDHYLTDGTGVGEMIKRLYNYGLEVYYYTMTKYHPSESVLELVDDSVFTNFVLKNKINMQPEEIEAFHQLRNELLWEEEQKASIEQDRLSPEIESNTLEDDNQEGTSDFEEYENSPAVASDFQSENPLSTQPSKDTGRRRATSAPPTSLSSTTIVEKGINQRARPQIPPRLNPGQHRANSLQWNSHSFSRHPQSAVTSGPVRRNSMPERISGYTQAATIQGHQMSAVGGRTLSQRRQRRTSEIFKSKRRAQLNSLQNSEIDESQQASKDEQSQTPVVATSGGRGMATWARAAWETISNVAKSKGRWRQYGGNSETEVPQPIRTRQ